MSISSKYQLMKGLEEKLGDVVSANSMNEIMGLIATELDGFEIESIGNCDNAGMDMLKAYLDAKLIEGRSLKTIERYRYIIMRMLESVKTPIRQISVFHLRSYLMKERERGVSDRTIEGLRETFSAFFNWLQRENLIQLNPAANLSPIKYQKKVRLPYSEIDIEKLKSACKSIRDKAMICFLLTTGCRISEVVGLNRDSVDFRLMSCRVLGKGNKERIVYFDNITAMYLRNYLMTRKDKSNALFVGKGSERMTPGGVRFMLNSVASIAGVEHVHPHRFRRTLATNLINRGMTIQEVARILGHDKLDTTMGYIYLDDQDMQNSYRKYS